MQKRNKMLTYSFTTAVVGVPGVGKTTLAKRLSKDLKLAYIGEPYEQNEFLPRMYADPARWSYATQLDFLHRGTEALLKLPFGDSYVTDWHPDVCTHVYQKYAENKGHLTPAEVRSLDQIRAYFSFWRRTPDTIVWLYAKPDVISDRLIQRGRSMENLVSLKHLKDLHDLTEQWLWTLPRKQVVAIDTTNRDLRDEAQYREVLEQIDKRLIPVCPRPEIENLYRLYNPQLRRFVDYNTSLENGKVRLHRGKLGICTTFRNIAEIHDVLVTWFKYYHPDDPIENIPKALVAENIMKEKGLVLIKYEPQNTGQPKTYNGFRVSGAATDTGFPYEAFADNR